jgi:cell division protein FtsQ
VLAVRTVRVVGATTLDPASVIAAAGVPVGTPLARVDVTGARARIEALPKVASVEVRRGWPHDLVLAVVERTPAAAVPTATGGVDLVDAGGVTFSHAASPGRLPVVRAPDSSGLRSALDVLSALPASLRATVVSARASTRDDVTLVLSSGATVRWGDASRGQRKAVVLAALVRSPARIYDVTAPDLPAVTR